MNPKSEDISAAMKFALDNQIDYFQLCLAALKTMPGPVLEIIKPDFDYFAAEFLKLYPEKFLQLAERQVSGLKQIDEICVFMRPDGIMGTIRKTREDTGAWA